MGVLGWLPPGPRWIRPTQVVLAGVLATGAVGVAVHGDPVGRRTNPGPAPVRILTEAAAPWTSEPVTTSIPRPAPLHLPTVTSPPVAARPVAKPAPPAPAWQPAHPRADFMGATLATRADAFTAPGIPTVLQSGTPGIDVSNWQGQIDWSAVATEGVRFAYIKATEATTFTDPDFAANYSGAAKAGLIRGAYHFAVPNASSGAAQADFFVDHGGSWTADGRTLPPALDIEYNPYGPDPCYGLSRSQMISWIGAFATTVYNRTDRWPVIYTTTNWWATCTGNSPAAGAHSPLWLASWAQSGQVRNRPEGWNAYTIWQYADRGTAPGDQDFFNGSYASLEAFASRSDRPQSPAGPVSPAPAPVTIPPAPSSQPPVTEPPPTTPAAPKPPGAG